MDQIAEEKDGQLNRFRPDGFVLVEGTNGITGYGFDKSINSKQGSLRREIHDQSNSESRQCARQTIVVNGNIGQINQK